MPGSKTIQRRKPGSGRVQIRPAEPPDIPALVELWTEFMDYHSALDPDYVRAPGATKRWAEYIGVRLGDDAYHVLVAGDGAALAGYVVATVMDYPPVFTIGKYGFIQEIAVAAPYRRSGIARRLLRAAEDWLLAAGLERVQVTIDVANAASMALFRSAGFAPHTERLIKKLNTDPGSGNAD